MTAAVLVGMLVLLYTARIETTVVVDFLKNAINTWGYPAVGLGCLLESIIGLQWISPGGMVILLTASQIAPAGELQFGLVLAIACVAMLCGYSISFLLGRAGYVTEGLSDVLTRFFGLASWPLLLVLALAHPSVAAPTFWLLGYSKIRYLRVIAVAAAAQLFWATLWALAGRAYGETFVVWLLDHRKLVSVCLALFYILLLLVRFVYMRRRKAAVPPLAEV